MHPTCPPTTGYRGTLNVTSNPIEKKRGCSSTLLRQINLLNTIYEDYDRACTNESRLTNQESELIRKIAESERENSSSKRAHELGYTANTPMAVHHGGGALHQQPLQGTNDRLHFAQHQQTLTSLNDDLEQIQLRLQSQRSFRKSIDIRYVTR